ncbi:MAG: hypothetical protein CSA95_00095 [Bacteroidetes bacterium]|nr:MAG: hypothetical protein CSA95_00095 [Bacteroidota bacterium]
MNSSLGISFRKPTRLLLPTLIILGLFLGGCSASRKLKERGGASLQKRAMATTLPSHKLPHTLKANFVLTLSTQTTGEEMTFHGQMRLTHDSVLWLNITKAGLEVARFMVTQDSLFMLSRMGRTFAREPLWALQTFTGAPVDFALIEGLLLGHDFKGYDTTQFITDSNPGSLRLYTTHRKSVNHPEQSIPFHALWLNPQRGHIERMEIRNNTAHLTADYMEFEETAPPAIPHTIRLEITARSPYRIDLHYTKIERDLPLKYPFKFSSSYQKISWL